MRSTCSALQLLPVALGCYLAAGLMGIVQGASGGTWIADNLNQAHMDYFFWLLAGLQVGLQMECDVSLQWSGHLRHDSCCMQQQPPLCYVGVHPYLLPLRLASCVQARSVLCRTSLAK